MECTKIDLLAAARCNMFSHVLVSYMSELKQFAEKTTGAFQTISKALEQKPKYDFCVLKELTQHEESNNNGSSFDKDQNLFFASDYADTDSTNKGIPSDVLTTEDVPSNESLIEICKNDAEGPLIAQNIQHLQSNTDDFCEINLFSKDLCSSVLSSKMSTMLKTQKNSTIANRGAAVKGDINAATSCITQPEKSHYLKNTKENSWIEIFAELDPLSNLEAFDMQLTGGQKNFQQT